MTNEQMIEGRILRWHTARERIKAITDHLKKGKRVVLATCTKATVYDARHIDMFVARKNGAFVKAGRQHQRLECIDGVAIRFEK